MEVKYVVPKIKETFGKLEFGGEIEVNRRRVNRRTVVTSREYSLFSEKQRADNITVILPVTAGEKRFEYEDEVKLVDPKICAEARVINGRGYVDYVLYAEDMVKVNEVKA